MSRTVVELANTTQDQLLAGMINDLLKTDQLTAALVANARITDRPTIKFNRLASVPTPVVASCTTTFTSQAISGNAYSVDLLTYAVQFNACTIGQNLYSSFDDVVAAELNGALQGMSHKILAGAVGAGNGSTDIFGLGSFAANQVSCATSGTLDVSDVDALIDAVKVKEAGQIFVGSPLAVRKLVKELRSEASMAWQELAGTALNTPAYRGYNIVAAEGLSDSKVYFFGPSGYGLWMGEKQDQSVGGIFGLQDLGVSQSKMESIYRLYAHIAGVSLNPQGLAVLNEIG